MTERGSGEVLSLGCPISGDASHLQPHPSPFLSPLIPCPPAPAPPFNPHVSTMLGRPANIAWTYFLNRTTDGNRTEFAQLQKSRLGNVWITVLDSTLDRKNG